ncbi:hypothetical protein CLI64_11010 [Nostoc sp. CENA543]|uniref:hypothetical protein n=1 Tax=Nostoc sp. CENA543 TaxID=1869241 RepID=UPI000CA30DD2|nr:hypothetical protein [Nostoc sp. CENA543]AUT00883.1 hypothetical protein CLI64_11010 [Nostoc sp. CENA543]
MSKKHTSLRLEEELLESLKLEADNSGMSLNDYLVKNLQGLVEDTLPLLNKEELPEQPSVYFVLDVSGQILYIGQTRNLKESWAKHQRLRQLESLGLVSIAWVGCEESELGSLETSLVEILKPKLNDQPRPHETTVAVRLPHSELELLTEYAQKTNRTVSEVIGDYSRTLR